MVDWVAEDRARDAGDILAFGSRTMWNGLLKPEVLDQHVTACPKVPFPGQAERWLIRSLTQPAKR